MATIESLTTEFVLLPYEAQMELVRQARKRRAERKVKTKVKKDNTRKKARRTTSKADRITHTLELLKMMSPEQKKALLDELGGME
jgi:hypothetical protein